MQFIGAATSFRFHQPPPKRLEQRDGVAIAGRLGLDAREQRLVDRPSRRSTERDSSRSQTSSLPAREIVSHFRGILRVDVGGERIGVGDRCMQRIGDVLVGRNHRALILGRGLPQRGLRRALSMQQRAAFEYGLGDAADHRPERAAGAEHPGELVGIAAERFR